MGFFDRLRRALGGGGKDKPPTADTAATTATTTSPSPSTTTTTTTTTSPTTSTTTEIEDALRAILTAKAGDPFPLLDRLRDDGHERLALEWLDKLALALADSPLRDEVRIRSGRWRADRGELRDALAHLQELLASPHAAEAHFLIAEHHRREGDLRAALTHLEAVLAIDVTYPNAQVRARAIRERLGAAAAAIAPGGETIAGPDSGAARTARYQLLRQLGRGATGAVYLARDVDLERQVAIKLLHAHLGAAAQSEARRRFFGEARVAAALRHPHIVAILDLDEKGRRIVMEHAAGGTLRERLGKGPLAPTAALVVHAELLSALAAAHARGIVHRDLKPANLLFRREGGELILTDFGVAHLAGADRRGAEREPVGTLAYMAPEQRRGEVTPATDLYAAGVILWECLAGKLPWSRDVALSGRRGERDLVLPADVRAAAGELAEPLEAHLCALGALDHTRRPDARAALAGARRLLELLRDGEELARLRQQLDAFRASLA